MMSRAWEANNPDVLLPGSLRVSKVASDEMIRVRSSLRNEKTQSCFSQFSVVGGTDYRWYLEWLCHFV
jgi:hypothetical protein